MRKAGDDMNKFIFHLEWNLSSPLGRVRLNFHILIVYSH